MEKKEDATLVIENIILPCVEGYRSESMQTRTLVVDLLGYLVYVHNHSVITDCLLLLKETLVKPFRATAEELAKWVGVFFLGSFTCGEIYF